MKILVVLLLCTVTVCSAQYGPGGVGSNDGLSSLALWISPDSNVSTTGAAVDSIVDISGHQRILTSSGTNRPDLALAALNGYNYLAFNRANYERLIMAEGISTINSNDSRTLLFIFKYNTIPQNLEIMGKSTQEMLDYGYWPSRSNSLRIRNVTVNAYAPNNTIMQKVWHINTVSYDGTNTRAWNDGALVVDAVSNAFAWGFDDGFNLGAANYLYRSYEGEIAEVILYSEALGTAKRTIIENYLTAKYGLPLTQRDLYTHDNPANGDFDHHVAGIGRIDVNDNHDDAQGTGIVRILNPTGLDDDEFLIWGNDSGLQRAVVRYDLPAGIQARFECNWRVSEVNLSGAPVDVGAVDIRFDLAGLGAITASDLRLLVDTDNDGLFADETPIGGATLLHDDVYGFVGVTTLANDLRFTIGTTNRAQTPLPVSLLDWAAQVVDQQWVALSWTTASESNNAFFAIERSEDADIWTEIGRVAGAGTTDQIQAYAFADKEALAGTAYYRLKQTDFDGSFQYSPIRSATIQQDDAAFILYPNPTSRFVTLSDKGLSLATITIFNSRGQNFTDQIRLVSNSSSKLTLDLSSLPKGLYFIRTPTAVRGIWKQ